LCLSVCLFLHF